MVARNKLLVAPPYRVEQALKEVGNNLRVARLRRKLTIEEVAEKIGTGTRAIRTAENGKPSTSVAVYAALLWVYDLLSPLKQLANPQSDAAGLAMADVGERARKSKGLDNDF